MGHLILGKFAREHLHYSIVPSDMCTLTYPLTLRCTPNDNPPTPFVLIFMLSVLSRSTLFRRKVEFRFMILSDGYLLATFGYDGKDEWTGPHGCEGKVAEEEEWRAGTVHHAVLRREYADARWDWLSLILAEGGSLSG